MAHIPYFCAVATLSVVLAALSCPVARAQEVYRASWTVQDKEEGLEQEIARTVIEHANDWATRDNPDAPTARVDDRLRVTIIAKLIPSTGEIRTSLEQLVMGNIVVENGFENFLEQPTIDSLIRRKHFWRDESVTVINEVLSPIPSSAATTGDIATPDYVRTFTAMEQLPRYRFSLEESTARLTPALYAWAGLGYDLLALPGISYGKGRAGVQYGNMKLWGEFPTPLGSSDANLLLSRGLEGAFGVGLAFETEAFGGTITWSDPSLATGPVAQASDTGALITRSALFYITFPLGQAPLVDGFLRLKIGPGYLQTAAITFDEKDSTITGAQTNYPKIMARLEYAYAETDGSIAHSANLEIFGTSILASYQQQISRILGFRITGAVHGALGERDSYLPAYSLILSPTISIW